MGAASQIQWTDHTFNPWIGCSKVSAGCAKCYAETLDDHRYSRTLDGGTKDRPVSHWGKGAPRHRTSKANWILPRRWNQTAICPCGFAEKIGSDDCRKCVNFSSDRRRRPRVFCASLADWLDDEVPIEWLADMLRVIHDCQNLDFLLLTKRPENWRDRIAAAMVFVDRDWAAGKSDRPALGLWLGWWLEGRRPANVWVGASVEDQPNTDERIPILLDIPALIRFVSYEPALGPVDFRRWLKIGETHPDGPAKSLIDWVIFGGESGKGARPCHVDWILDGVRQCKAAGVAPFVKQLGTNPQEIARQEFVTDREDAMWKANGWTRITADADKGCYWRGPLVLRNKKGGDPAEWPDELRVREWPKVKRTIVTLEVAK